VIRIAGTALPYDATYHLLTRFDKLGAILRAERPDVVEAHSPYLAAAGVARFGTELARLTTTFWHSNHFDVYVRPVIERAFGEGRARGRKVAEAVGAKLHWMVRALLAPFDATFVAGRQQAAMLSAAGVSPVFHVPFGTDVATFRPDARSEDARRALLSGHAFGTRRAGRGADGTVLLVGVGRLAFEKRWDVVIDAFARIRERRRAVLALFGDGPERGRLEARAPEGVRFLGHEADRGRIAAALASADVLVHGCACETYGLGVLEGVACGLPVVVPDRGGALDGGASGHAERYESLQADACAAAIERVLDALERGGLRERCLDASRRVPTVEQHVRTVLATYDDLLRPRR
jgi:alpha-1,6-mannosyltransferase